MEEKGQVVQLLEGGGCGPREINYAEVDVIIMLKRSLQQVLCSGWAYLAGGKGKGGGEREEIITNQEGGI